jgi:hypothetical protein
MNQYTIHAFSIDHRFHKRKPSRKYLSSPRFMQRYENTEAKVSPGTQISYDPAQRKRHHLRVRIRDNYHDPSALRTDWMRPDGLCVHAEQGNGHECAVAP